MATPERCACEHLNYEVARLLLSDGKSFGELAARTFPANPPGPWLLERYDQFFSALEGWSTYAHHNAGKDEWQGRQLNQWRAHLLEQVERTGALVLPIVDQGDEDALQQLVNLARPLVRGRAGIQRDEHIYLMSTSTCVRRPLSERPSYCPKPYVIREST